MFPLHPSLASPHVSHGTLPWLAYQFLWHPSLASLCFPGTLSWLTYLFPRHPSLASLPVSRAPFPGWPTCFPGTLPWLAYMFPWHLPWLAYLFPWHPSLTGVPVSPGTLPWLAYLFPWHPSLASFPGPLPWLDYLFPWHPSLAPFPGWPTCFPGSLPWQAYLFPWHPSTHHHTTSECNPWEHSITCFWQMKQIGCDCTRLQAHYFMRAAGIVLTTET